jgi:N-6 DNA Methylase/Eco57I restriction-modification methylase
MGTMKTGPLLARVLGFEPRIADPKSAALPLGHTRMMYERAGGSYSIISSKGAQPLVSHALYSTRYGRLCQHFSLISRPTGHASLTKSPQIFILQLSSKKVQVRKPCSMSITYHSSSSPERIASFVRQVKQILGSVQTEVCAQFTQLQQHYEHHHPRYAQNNSHFDTLSAAYNSWKLWMRSPHNAQAEFCLQTAYMQFLRIFFIHVCQDYAQDNLHPSSVLPALCQTPRYAAIKLLYLRLLQTIYPDTHIGKHRFLEQQLLYDWYTPGDTHTTALLNLLHDYDFRDMRSDVLGRVYSEGHIEHQIRSEKGQFYTLPQVVDYMLDTLGMPAAHEARSFLEKTVGDLACGTGSFLVAVAARKRMILQHLIDTHQATPDYALRVLTSTVLGFDLNPFACFLAEMNLLLQCLPFLLNQQGQLCRSIDRLHIYCADVLEPTATEQKTMQFQRKTKKRARFRPIGSVGQELTDEERCIARIKESKGLSIDEAGLHTAEQGIDYLVGNPPYVSASESPDNLRYRDTVYSFGIYHLLHQRWDLFVPFFERNLQFLRPATGRLGLIVSNGIETEGYAERLRQALSSRYKLLQIDFFPNLRLFQDAAVENTIVFLENSPPGATHEVTRRKHVQADCWHFETLPPMLQSATNQVFRWRYDHAAFKVLTAGTLPLCAIAYTGTGMEAQSNEIFDPVIEGKRQKRFTLDDVFLTPTIGTEPLPEYTDEGVLGDDVGQYYLRCKRHVAYEKYRTQMRAPRHVALFRTPEKLLLGETSGGYYDQAGLFANHSVQLVVPWKALEQEGALEERGIRRVYRKSCQIVECTGSLVPISEMFDLRYLLGIINSRFMREFMVATLHEGTRKNRIYPDVWKCLPIKIASFERQRQIALLVEELQEMYKQPEMYAPEEEQQTNTAIAPLLSQIEDLVEATYKDSV